MNGEYFQRQDSFFLSKLITYLTLFLFQV